MAQNSGQNLSSAQAVSDACEMCHSYWDNMPNIGVTGFNRQLNETIGLKGAPNPYALTDIYGNTISPYGLATTDAYNITINASWSGGTDDNGYTVAVPWTAGIDTYQYTDSTTHTTYSRLDYVWSNLSSISPMPATYNFVDQQNSTTVSCDSTEKGMCHIAKSAIVQAELGKLPEASTLFRHEMAYTTDQYAAKPVKLCGACHVDKLPPMTWGGEPWSQGVIQAASANNGSAPLALNGVNNNPYDPFGFQPAYDSTGFVNVNNTPNQYSMAITYKTPDWAHANVPCIRCHEHAGINGATVSNNAPTGSAVALPYNKGAPSLP